MNCMTCLFFNRATELGDWPTRNIWQEWIGWDLCLCGHDPQQTYSLLSFYHRDNCVDYVECDLWVWDKPSESVLLFLQE